MVGLVFGFLIVKEVLYKGNKKKRKYYLCLCSCGKIIFRRADYIISGKCTHCGCKRKNYENLIDKTFNYLTVTGLKIDNKSHGRYRRLWICKCKCGNIITIKRPDALKNGDIKSCGCYSKETIKKAVKSITLTEGQASFNALYSSYIRSAKERQIPFFLNKKQFKFITLKVCFYCKSEPIQIHSTNTNGCYIYNGIDRINNSIGYLIDNCVPCCKICNYMKRNLSGKEFLKHVKNIFIYQHHGIFINLDVKDYNDLIAFNILKREYIKNAKNKNIGFTLSDTKFKQITKSNCFYCGVPPKNIRENLPKRIHKYTFNGIDRLNNDKGYTIKNCVPCCKNCNYMKRNHTRNEFLKHIDKVFTKHLNL